MTSQPLKPGDRAPDFELPAADREGVFVLAWCRAETKESYAVFPRIEDLLALMERVAD